MLVGELEGQFRRQGHHDDPGPKQPKCGWFKNLGLHPHVSRAVLVIGQMLADYVRRTNQTLNDVGCLLPLASALSGFLQHIMFPPFL